MVRKGSTVRVRCVGDRGGEGSLGWRARRARPGTPAPFWPRRGRPSARVGRARVWPGGGGWITAEPQHLGEVEQGERSVREVLRVAERYRLAGEPFRLIVSPAGSEDQRFYLFNSCQAVDVILQAQRPGLGGARLRLVHPALCEDDAGQVGQIGAQPAALAHRLERGARLAQLSLRAGPIAVQEVDVRGHVAHAGELEGEAELLADRPCLVEQVVGLVEALSLIARDGAPTPW